MNNYHYATTRTLVLDEPSRFEKAEKIFLLLAEKYPDNLQEAVLLDIGCSAGLIDYWLAAKVRAVYGLDIDQDILASVKQIMQKTCNFRYIQAGGHQLPFRDRQFDIILANAMYYLLPPPAQQEMLQEIQRCLKPHGMCYFAGPNRLIVLDGKHRLPFLTWLPEWLARKYVRWCSPFQGYHEYYHTLFGLKKMLARYFTWEDVTLAVIDQAAKYKLLKHPNVLSQFGVSILARMFYIFLPTYIFLLRSKKEDG